MIKIESILKWTVEGSLLKKLKMVRAQILSKNPDAVAISDKDLHITLAAGSGWQKLRSRIKAKDVDEPEFSIDIDPIAKVIEKGGSKSWYVKLKNQQDWKEYVMDSLQGTYDSGRVYHISIANLTGNKMDSVPMVEDRDYKNEYKKFQSSTKSKKYRAELNRYNRQKGTYGNGDKKDASHRNGKIVGFEDESVNRGRAEKSRIKKPINEEITNSSQLSVLMWSLLVIFWIELTMIETRNRLVRLNLLDCSKGLIGSMVRRFLNWVQMLKQLLRI